ncbi:hypothetical protein BJ878DRAFT_223288 [Calycina marina]|uniref:Uncharacterized protein n=1 Tax=Calycina marina TaxID=1763456 RepID=A0A9P7Z7S1_9HELO|nr:hypothetical protein BJ878DRAFT_223288 [Calycina marina]
MNFWDAFLVMVSFCLSTTGLASLTDTMGSNVGTVVQFSAENGENVVDGIVMKVMMGDVHAGDMDMSFTGSRQRRGSARLDTIPYWNSWKSKIPLGLSVQ